MQFGIKGKVNDSLDYYHPTWDIFLGKQRRTMAETPQSKNTRTNGTTIKVREFELPCHIMIGSRKPRKIGLTMNWYRHAGHFEIDKVKSSYWPLTGERFKASRISIEYTLYLPNNRRTDLMNWVSIADKFFLDWLVATQCLKDDSVREYSNVAAKVEKSCDSETHIIARIQVLE